MSNQKRPPKDKEPKRNPGDLPQNGWRTDAEWAARFDQPVEEFRRKVREAGIPYIQWGYTMVVSADDFFGNAPRNGKGRADG